MDETVEIKTEREREATGPYPTTPPLFTACSAEEVRRRNLPLLGDTLPSSLSSSPSYFTRRLRDRPPPRSRSWRRPENPSPLRTRGREKGRRERVHRFDVIPLWEKKRKEGSYRNQAARVSYTRLILRRERECMCAFLSLSLSFSPASNFNYTATRRARFDARPVYQDNGFHRRPMVRIYPIRGKGLRLISIASRYPSPADRFVRIFPLSLSLSSRTASTGYSVHEATTRHDDTIRYDTVFFFFFFSGRNLPSKSLSKHEEEIRLSCNRCVTIEK